MKRESSKWELKVLMTLAVAIFNIALVAAENSDSSHTVVIRRIKESKEFRSLPKRHTTFDYNGTSYYEANSRYYVKSDDSFRFTTPPAGLKVNELPEGATMFEYLDRKYYSFRGIIYKHTTDGEYEVTLPEIGMTLTDMPETTTREVLVDGDLYIEVDGMMYKPIMDGEHYIVVCTFDSLAS